MDNNTFSYKALRAKSSAKRRSVFDFDRTMSSLVESLLPAREQGNAAAQEDPANKLEELSGEYDKKLQLIEKSQEKKFTELSRESQSEIDRLGKQIQSRNEQNTEINQSLKEAIERLARSKQGEREQEDVSTEEKEQVSTPAKTADTYNDGMEVPQYSGPQVAQEAEVANNNNKAVVRMAKKIVGIDDVISVGENKYRITNLFGQRSGKNSVSGVSSSEHSRGLDLVGYSKDGKTSNLPIALTEGEILSVNVQGSGEPIHPKNGRAAGYYMNVKMPDGKIMKYMHLGEDAWRNKAQLIGKKINRGDLLYEGNYSKGSGSQTSPHIKVSITSLDASGKELRDFSAPENDPTPYALYGSYVEEY